MLHRGAATKEDAYLLLSKWYEEQTPLYIVLSVGLPSTSFRLNMPGLITELDPNLIVSHADGRKGGFLTCAWSDIEAFEYSEMRDEAERLVAYPGASQFMRYRSILAIIAKHDLLIRLVDLTLTF